MKRIHWMLVLATLGIILLGIGQRLSLPDFYGTTIYSAHAHIMVAGVLLVVGALVTELCWRVATSRSRAVRHAGRRQLFILAGATVAAGLYRLTTDTRDDFLPEGTSSTLPTSGDANQGALVLWILLIILSTLINLVFLTVQASAARRQKRT